MVTEQKKTTPIKVPFKLLPNAKVRNQKSRQTEAYFDSSIIVQKNAIGRLTKML